MVWHIANDEVPVLTTHWTHYARENRVVGRSTIDRLIVHSPSEVPIQYLHCDRKTRPVRQHDCSIAYANTEHGKLGLGNLCLSRFHVDHIDQRRIVQNRSFFFDPDFRCDDGKKDRIHFTNRIRHIGNIK